MAREGAASSARFDSETSKRAVMEGGRCKAKVKLGANGCDGCAEVVRHALHSQVMKIREEDQHLGEDWREGVSPRDRIAILQITSQMKDVFFSCSRPAFPSPLGMKAGVRSA